MTTKTVTPDGVLSFDGATYDPSADSGLFRCPRLGCSFASGWAGGPVDLDEDYDPIRDHMDWHAEQDDAAPIDAVPGVERDPAAVAPEVPRLSSPAGLQALLHGRVAPASAAVDEAATKALADVRAQADVVAAALDWYGSEPGIPEGRAMSALDVACSRLVELRGGIR
ncbi:MULTISPECIES: hypothetical protein [unclassified Isoptericola]|uniref:hypothetical protein n=1 Tax=unclassified Isoptericola TaxID=2623355 RepID=UPI00365E8340